MSTMSWLVIACAFILCVVFIFAPDVVRWMAFVLRSVSKQRKLSSEEKDRRGARWYPDSSNKDGQYQSIICLRTPQGRVVSMYEIGNPVPIDDDNFPVLRIELFERARIRADSLNNELA